MKSHLDFQVAFFVSISELFGSIIVITWNLISSNL